MTHPTQAAGVQMHSRTRLQVLALLLACEVFVTNLVAAEKQKPFTIQVLDSKTGRGVPLVELETTNHIVFITDSAGRAVIADADLTGQKIYFHIRSHGYDIPADGFGLRGMAFQVVPGQHATVTLKATNLAERLYRVTGSGIYRDTLLAGETPPIQQPLLNGKVFGCDSVLNVIYQGKLYWFWGDTIAPHYPLGGSFHMTGATSDLPEKGGLPPDQGVNLKYFMDENGLARPMAKMPGEGPTWVTALTVLKDETGRERMYGSYVKIKNMLEAYRWGFVVWNDNEQCFDEVSHFDTAPAVFLEPQAHPFLHREKGGAEYVYFASPFPLTRVRATSDAFLDPAQYEGWTCLKPGTTLAEKQVERANDGSPRFTWQRNTPALTQKQQRELIQAGVMKIEDASVAITSQKSGRPVLAHFGSTCWNSTRSRWVSVFTEEGGDPSHLGEIWYAEAAELTGPWMKGVKIVSHDKYTFYNPRIHAEFSEPAGRYLYFEGTYTQAFSGNAIFSPRYDYNQIMYRLDLSLLDPF